MSLPEWIDRLREIEILTEQEKVPDDVKLMATATALVTPPTKSKGRTGRQRSELRNELRLLPLI